MTNFNQRSLVHPHWQSAAHPCRPAGMTLVELMVAMTVGLMLVLGISTLLANQSATQVELEKSTRQIENGRYTTQVLRDDIELAGYYGEYSSTGAVPGTLPDPCKTSGWTADIPLHVQGYDSPSTVPSALATCASAYLVDANFKPNTDILVIRRTDTATINTGAAAAGQPYLQAGLVPSGQLFGMAMGTGSDLSPFTLKLKDGTTLAPLRKYVVHIYYVSRCNVPASGTSCNGTSDDNGTPIPTLKRLELTSDGAAARFVSTPLAEGIENLQFDYGLDTDGDGAPDSYTTAPASVADWGNVVSIRINVLARNNDRSVGYSSNTQYNLGGAGSVGPFSDNYKRHAFTALVRVTNPSARREK